ncbi:DNA primase [Mycoplasmopsis cynos]|uniref:DNA primase n=2 Tax=Mycoplasmopsis cynos TaxID=171284 RepID=A0ABD8AJ60_9BACT|nr:DNA primase [Mycoplasmopsis cynos]MCU9935472.1 DNA primase [Mycoplasmopsis cynos]UWV80320.1 DNA primase [Mycoplasmopsis cynos]UWV86553.1 DNA primase [Mycoplasmopsis cynos]WAM05801.1 DNA primase [Mycoplasmopsis cynos]WQQ14879.1 DNA primase [Mycoplasmopsis cynos]
MPNLDFKKINEEILNSIDIVNLISSYISLTKKGNNYIGLCPFHQDTTPSFTISPIKKIYKCFSCSESGNAITFVKKYLNKNYYQSLEFLAKELNLNYDFSAFLNSHLPQMTDEELEITEALNVVNAFYKIQIFKNSKAQEYLASRNLLDDELRKKFDIGYAPENELIEYFSQNTELDKKILFQAGLINDNFKELFKNRITFGIRNSYGNIVGFSARVLNNQQKPKYLNSPETKLFNKSQILYNFFNAKEHIEKNKEVIIVEGFMDVIALDKVGIYNSVALMGTALTLEHLQLIKKYQIALFLDNDEAGIQATLKSIKTLLKNKIYDVFVIVNPYDKDPDEILNNEGKESLLWIFNQKTSCIDFLYQTLVKSHNLNNNYNYSTLSSFINEILDYYIYLNNDQKNYIENKIKIEFNFDLSKTYNKIDTNANAFIESDFYDYYYNSPQEIYIDQSYNKFKDIFATNIRLKFLMYFVLKPNLAKKFYELDNSAIIFSKPDDLFKAYDKIKDLSYNYFELLNSQAEPTIDEIIKNTKNQMHTIIKSIIKKISPELNDIELNNFYEQYLDEINQVIIDNSGKVSLSPLIQELIDVYKFENEALNIVPSPKQNSNLMKELKKFKNTKI